MGEWARRDEIHPEDGTSHSFRVESRDVERIFLPCAMIPVEDIERVCPRRVRAGATRVLGPVAVSDEDAGNSAERMVREKSPPAERSTREEGKNWRAVTVLRCALEVSRCGIGDVMECGMLIWGSGKEEFEDGGGEIRYMKTEPSRNPEANLVPSGDTSNAVICWGRWTFERSGSRYLCTGITRGVDGMDKGLQDAA